MKELNIRNLCLADFGHNFNKMLPKALRRDFARRRRSCYSDASQKITSELAEVRWLSGYEIRKNCHTEGWHNSGFVLKFGGVYGAVFPPRNQILLLDKRPSPPRFAFTLTLSVASLTTPVSSRPTDIEAGIPHTSLANTSSAT